MLKRIVFTLGILAAGLSPVYAAGTVPGFSLTPQFDLQGQVIPGCKLYIYVAGTVSTPQNSYQDTGLTNLQPNPLVCDASGRLPQWFVADGTIKVRLTDKNGQTIFAQDNLLVVGPSSGGGGGGGGSVDPTTIIATGDLKVRYGTGTLSGYVRANGRTIGSATSGASERANADCQALFEYLWGADANLTVSGGRGASANADWVANKTITLPDWSGRALAGLDDMGGGARGVLTSAYFGTSPAVLGAAGGTDGSPIAQNQLPNIAPTFSGYTDPVTVTSNRSDIVVLGFPTTAGSAGGIWAGQGAIAITSSGTFTPRGLISSINGNVTQVGRSNLQPTRLATIYIKM